MDRQARRDGTDGMQVVKENIATFFNICGVVFHYTFIPVVIYLGVKAGTEPGMPPISIGSILFA
ncbi:hypothetical protein RvY_00813 [Ramazzottius varieornatus]|uniref:Mitochondrial import receptor subunit TOM7 homolog n=1 Tax=Ramazzottius varieornatus TaxID=947166 RepID=A0A1D1UNV7_RAMVA|nr:hypothetical protein RvY_00813 [Ramazzottius varieornatus]